MARLTEWYYNGYFIELIDGKYKADIDGSLWNTLDSAKAHIDYLTK
jgi:hypothetical protein